MNELTSESKAPRSLTLAKAFAASFLVTWVRASHPGVGVVIRLRAFAIQS